MPLIIDTYNLLHVTGILPPEIAGIDVPGLIRLLHQSRYRHERIDLVCDGSPRADVPSGRAGGVHIRYAGPGKEADGLIARMIQQSSSPRRLTVVSSDHAVQRAARVRKCRVLTSQVLLQQLALDAERPDREPDPSPAADAPIGGLSNGQVDRWLQEFGVDPEAIERESRPETRPLTRPPSAGFSGSSGPCESSGSCEPGESGMDPHIPREDQPRSKDREAGREQLRGAALPEEIVAEAERLAREAQRSAPPGGKTGESE